MKKLSRKKKLEIGNLPVRQAGCKLGLVISGVVLILNLFIFHSPILGVVFSLGFIILSSYLLNKNWLVGFLYFLCCVIIPLTLIYYIWELNNWVIVGWFILFTIFVSLKNKVLDSGFITCTPKKYFAREQVGIPAPNKKFYLIVIYFILLIISYFILKSGATTEPVRTPWFFVPKWFFVFYFLATVWLIFIFKKLKNFCKIILSIIHFFFSFSVANIIFPLGFGFDPFIHSATQKFILENGFILPKKLYYIGQYALVFWLTKIFSISQNFINTHLAPLLSAILIPSSIYYAFKKYFTPFIFLIIPFAYLTFTTPQNLGYLLVLVLIFTSINNQPALPAGRQSTINDSLFLMVLMSLMILMIHPIAGISAVIFTLVTILNKLKLKKWFKAILYGISCFASIIIFWLFKLITNFEVNFVNNFNLKNFINNSFRFFPDLYWQWNLEHILKTIAYFLWQPIVLFIILLLLSVFVLIKFSKKKDGKLEIGNWKLGNYFITFIILFINSLLLYSFVKFPFLINYEQGDFAYRIFILASFFLIPLALVFIMNYVLRITKSEKKPRILTAFIILLISAGVTVGLYISYPRQDVYAFNRGFNVSKYDIAAIKYLENISAQGGQASEDYVVLANQQVGAAALQKFGFRYFDNKYFFYSIPTGGELYQIYWNIVYQDAGREEIKKAADFTGAKIIYVYFPNYWFNLQKMKINLRCQADNWFEVEGGIVFEFNFQ